MTIELNRRFVEWSERETSDPDLIARFGRTESTLNWDDLLARRRAVLLAEAGSGKTTEMVARARQLANVGRPAFYATLGDVGRLGLEAALKVPDRAQLAAWKASDQDAWFFINSIDEAKNDGVKLGTALRAIAGAIAGAERRSICLKPRRFRDRADITIALAQDNPSDQFLKSIEAVEALGGGAVQFAVENRQTRGLPRMT